MPDADVQSGHSQVDRSNITEVGAENTSCKQGSCSEGILGLRKNIEDVGKSSASANVCCYAFAKPFIGAYILLTSTTCSSVTRKARSISRLENNLTFVI